ncbi:MAG: ribonuclease HII, partial [Streptococcaceae bacterium]|nr:ribonuclease HII [Streptococcaceae bacterium]
MAMKISEVKAFLESIENSDDERLLWLAQDDRKGVKSLLNAFHNRMERRALLESRFEEMNAFENELRASNVSMIAGIDEVGRGPLAGPVVASAVILDEFRPILGLNDSKKLTHQQRETLFLEIQEKAVAIGLSILPPEKIDEVNILEATKLAMIEALGKLNPKPQHLLIDALLLNVKLP